MYLKNLTVLGFKSFADKTSLNFLPGVTAIVGPNGCGKSNVSDAIRWVLGEQSAKALRGGEMADVIFSGTDKRKATGIAEVSLTIGDIDQDNLTAAGVELEYNEVTVTRRVFRDGGSEYFINKAPCRLKDIQQLFMGTGVGRTSYSIMAQGNITQILSSRPEDRRMIFEEAAGITKFKAQKKEALRKLDNTDQNLLRVEDLIREVKRQIGSLQRQAGKARRYKALSEELQHLETQLARHQYDVLLAEIMERNEKAETLRRDIETGSQSALKCEEEIRQLRERLAELEQTISESQRRGMELKGESERHEHRIQVNQERLQELQDQNAKALADIAQADEKRLLTEEELARVKERLTASQETLSQRQADLENKRASLHTIEQDLMSNQERLREAQSESFATAQSLTQVRNEINALDLQKQGNVVRLEKLSSEKIQLEEERNGLEARLDEFKSNVDAEKLNVENQRGTVEQRQDRLKEILEQLNQTAQELDGLVTQQAEHKSRLNVLDQLQTNREGFGSGAQAALQHSESVLGSLSDKIRVPDQYVTAVEAVLGHYLQIVLTENSDYAQTILADLRTQEKGRASVAAVGWPLAGHGTGIPESILNEHCVPAMRVVEAEEPVRPLMERLLGRTVIVPDLATATALWNQSEGACDFITQQGDLLTREGVYTGGSAEGSQSAAASILGRKNEMEELKQLLSRLANDIGNVSRQKGALQSEQTSLQASLQQAQSELRAQEVAIATREGEFNALQNSQRTLVQKIETVVFEVQSLAAQEQEGKDKRESLISRLHEAEDQEKTLSDRVAEFTGTVERLRQEREQANGQLTEAKVALASEEQVCTSLDNQRAPLEQRIQELEQRTEQRRLEIANYESRKGQFEGEISESTHHIDRLRHDREVNQKQTSDHLLQRETQVEEISRRENTLKEERQQLSEHQEKRSQIDIELAQKNMSVENLKERIQSKYQVDLNEVRSECITITYADEGKARINTLTPEEMTEAGVATDWNAVAEQVTAMQDKIDAMGPVNLVAIEEYEETEQRYNFLTTQHEDLVQAKEQLLEVINRINTQTQEMFRETFARIRENFQGLFTEIFGGGKADLNLVDENNVLESGIEIMARPPGKKLQSISLLSGGEQTMTAVALLFSIYQVKPSPFCVLDELDAPLDESNINRFIRVLKRFLENSQFIIITHNKRTIGMADVLYGVTMQEQGVSRIVSVKFHKTEEEVTDHKPESLETPVPDHKLEEEEDKIRSREETMEVAMAD